MSDLTNKTVEELRDQVLTSARVGYAPTGMKAFDELARRLAKAQAKIDYYEACTTSAVKKRIDELVKEGDKC
jgi:hypothetical protein